MSGLHLEVRVLPAAADTAGHDALQGTRLLSAGDRAGAERLFARAMKLPVSDVPRWVNLAALGVGLGHWEPARDCAAYALRVDPGNADAWVNLGAASWGAGRRRDAAQATHRALELAPAMEAAALNLHLMFRAVGQPERGHAVLAGAVARNPGSYRLQQALAEACRLQGDVVPCRRHALLALAALLPTLAPRPHPDQGPEPDDAEARARLVATMTDACDRLQDAGIPHHLVGGVVIGIVREGKPFAGDKDVDFGVDFGADRDAVAASFADGYSYIRTPSDTESRRWCMGFVHDATGVGVDLFFKQPVGDVLRINLGWPDGLVFDLPAYRVEPFHWQGRDWPMPAPLEDYLAADYGADWRSPTRESGGHVFDKRWLDSQISSPSLSAESVPRAINLTLLRLLAALFQERWPKALALCDQLLGRESIGEVGAIQARLLAAGIR